MAFAILSGELPFQVPVEKNPGTAWQSSGYFENPWEIPIKTDPPNPWVWRSFLLLKVLEHFFKWFFCFEVEVLKMWRFFLRIYCWTKIRIKMKFNAFIWTFGMFRFFFASAWERFVNLEYSGALGDGETLRYFKTKSIKTREPWLLFHREIRQLITPSKYCRMVTPPPNGGFFKKDQGVPDPNGYSSRFRTLGRMNIGNWPLF